MTTQHTLCIIKPDAIKRNIQGEINKVIQSSGIEIISAREMVLTPAQVGEFYAEHKDRPFFGDLISIMSDKTILVQLLRGDDAILKYRTLMGATNPENADEGTLRKMFAISMQENSVHGSDSIESAEREVDFFFGKVDLINS